MSAKKYQWLLIFGVLSTFIVGVLFYPWMSGGVLFLSSEEAVEPPYIKFTKNDRPGNHFIEKNGVIYLEYCEIYSAFILLTRVKPYHWDKDEIQKLIAANPRLKGRLLLDENSWYLKRKT